MAMYIEITKSNEIDENFIFYCYKFSIAVDPYINTAGKKRYNLKSAIGKLKIDKKKGEVHIIQLADGDNGNHAQRAAHALMKHWELGEFPEKTCWAS